jgi:alanine transaminase
MLSRLPFRFAAAFSTKPLTIDTVNPRLREVEYAIRGAIVDKADELESQLASGVKLPFEKILRLNQGNPMLFNQQPISFLR